MLLLPSSSLNFLSNYPFFFTHLPCQSAITLYSIILDAEFWKQVPTNEPYRVILGDLRDKLYNTREYARQLIANGVSEISEEATLTNLEQVCSL